MNKRLVAEPCSARVGVQDQMFDSFRVGTLDDGKQKEESHPNTHRVVFRTQDWERMAREADFRPAKMASLCSISERHLQRIFKKYLECTPSYWLRELQCRLAKSLISQGYSSKAAAAELKFATEAHFCREFKKIFGASPQSYAPNHVGYLKLALLEKSAEADMTARSVSV